MDFTELVRSRRTVHSYRPATVPEEWVKEALALSLWAPNHRLTFPWIYIQVGPQARTKLADLAVELKSKKSPLSEVQQKAVRDNVLNPSHLIMLGIRRHESAQQMHEDFATLACSVQIASLYLWQKNVATKWSTGGVYIHDKTYEILGIKRSEIQLQGCLIVGEALMVPAAPTRPDLNEFLSQTP